MARTADWQSQAACLGIDPAVFFPASDDDAAEAKAICARCPVADACLEFALETRQHDGIWGGLTEAERRRLRRRRRREERRVA